MEVQIVKVSDFLKKVLNKDVGTKVILGSEAMFLAEIQKFVRVYGIQLQLDLELEPRLYGSVFETLLYKQGIVAKPKGGVIQYQERFFPPETYEKPFTYTIREQDSVSDVYIFDGTKVGFYSVARYYGLYLGVIADIIVEQYIRKPAGWKRTIQFVTGDEPTNYDKVLPLIYYGNRWLKDIVEIQTPITQADWRAYATSCMQFKKPKDYLPAEKAEYAKKHFQKGDVIGIYQRTSGTEQDDRIRNLAGFKVGVVVGVDDYSIGVKEYANLTTYLQQHAQIEREIGDMSDTKRVDARIHDFATFTEKNTSYAWMDTGIISEDYEYLLSTEDYFVTHLMDGDSWYMGLIVQDKDSGKYKYEMRKLDVFDCIYAFAENRGITYNKDGFLSRYFKDRVPFYDTVRRWQPQKTPELAKWLRARGIVWERTPTKVLVERLSERFTEDVGF